MTIQRTKKYRSRLLGQTNLSPSAAIENWRRIALLGVNRSWADRQVSAEAINTIYYHLGLNDPWIVYCDDPAVLHALSELLPVILASHTWADISAQFKRFVYPNEDWSDLWARLFVHELDARLKDLEYDIELMMKTKSSVIPHIVQKVRAELTRRLRSEARQSDELNQKFRSQTRHDHVETTRIRMRIERRLRQFEGTMMIVPQRAPLNTELADALQAMHLVRSQASGLLQVYRQTLFDEQEELQTVPAWMFAELAMYPLLRTKSSDRTGLYEAEIDELDAWTEVIEVAGPVIFSEYVAYICAKPTSVQTDEWGRIHSAEAPAIAWGDAFHCYALRDVAVDGLFFTDPGYLTAEMIKDLQNVEMRRRLMEFYGFERYINDLGGKLIHKDETGELYRLEDEIDEPLHMVRVKNSTPEPDGTYKYYMLRVPPHLDTARESVAWTFGLTADRYKPEEET